MILEGNNRMSKQRVGWRESVRWRHWAGWLGLGTGILLFMVVREGETVQESRRTVRYLLFSWVALLAWILPYISFPDPKSGLWQLLNRSNRWYHTHLLARHRYLVTGGALLLIATVITGPDQIRFGLESLWVALYALFFLLGVWGLAVADLIGIGARSQYWQESDEGRALALKVAAIAKYPVDPGSLPTLLSTMRLALVGMGGVVVGAWAFSLYGPLGELSVALLLFLIGFVRYGSKRQRAAAHYYQTNAFFSEFFTPPRTSVDGERELAPNQLWWIPSSLRIHAWALLVQLDRTLPAGRVLLVGHLLIWVLAYSGAEGSQLWVFWCGFALLHQAWILPTGSSDLAPAWLLRTLATPWRWMQIRFWMQVRWLLPLLASAGVMQWLFGPFGTGSLLELTGVYLLASLATSAVVTIRTNHRSTFVTKRTMEHES
ncbi:MAG: hypothetical protein WD115_01640 [Balneolaceae bacterium]